ncbi:hypothetical protein [Synechococcus sp. UW179A]|nr:hypothetical protein [Synechococcus sp. UW179A]
MRTDRFAARNAGSSIAIGLHTYLNDDQELQPALQRDLDLGPAR